MRFHLLPGMAGRRAFRRVDLLAGLGVTVALVLGGLLVDVFARRVGRGSAPGAGELVDDVVLAAVAGAACVPLLARLRRGGRARDARLSELAGELGRRRAVEAGERGRVMDTQERVAWVIQTDALSVHLQPIFDVSDGTGPVTGYEALARFPDGRGPETWFEEAHCVGLGAALDTYAFIAALRVLPSLPPDVYLSVNVSPDTLLWDGFWPALPPDCDAHRLVVELTEHVRVEDYDLVKLLLDRLRRLGARIAVDDAGAGFASLRHIVHLAPDVIKLDRGLIRCCDVDPVRRTLAEALAGFAQRIGAALVAEGVETAGELDTLRAIGVGQAQGYLLARPAPAGDLVSPAAAATP